MSHSSKIFEEAPIKVQNKNGFDLSHLNCGTSKTGQLVPVMCKLLPPNSDFTLGVSMNVELPPLATQAMGRVDAIVEGFLIPLSILYGGWKQFISNQQETMFPVNQGAVVTAGGFAVPYFDLAAVSHSQTGNLANFNTLLGTNDNIVEYLGARISPGQGASVYNTSLLPLLAYHLCWNVYYRNKQVTKSIFAVNPNTQYGSALNTKNVSLVWHSFYNGDTDASAVSGTSGAKFDSAASLTFPDGVSVFSTRQRNYARDYFTAAMLDPQQGNPSTLKFSVDAQGDGEFTIASLRAANALQKFLETNSLSGDYSDMMRNRWGTRPIDADFDEPYYLGRVVVPVYQKSVYQSNSFDGAGGMPSGSPNPFVSDGALGSKAAHASFVGEGSITQKFHNSTWSYVMCLFSLVPHAAYGYGLNRELLMTKIGDFPAPEMQTVGHEDISLCELWFDPTFGPDNTFAYIPRYSRFKYMDDEIHGELRPGRTLDSFVIQRRFSFPPGFTTSFLEIPQNALDSIFAVSTSSMNLSCWYEIYFRFRVVMPLADFCIPTLGDIADTHTIHTPVGGSKL